MNTNYDIIVVLTADMLEDGMVLRGTAGREYTIGVKHLDHGQTEVHTDWGTITYTDNAVGCNFLTSYELSRDFGLDPEPIYFMFGADGFGSIAEMPLAAYTHPEAVALADQWLAAMDHGFVQAVVVGLDVQHIWQGDPVDKIWDRITHGLPDRQHLL